MQHLLNKQARRTLIWSAGGVLFAAGVSPVLNNVVDTEHLRLRIIDAVEHQTGRLMKVERVHIQALPYPSVQMYHVELEGNDAQKVPIIQVEYIKGQLSLFSLLQKQLFLKKVILYKPELRFNRDRGGKSNWQSSHKVPPQTMNYSLSGSSVVEHWGISFGTITLDDAEIIWNDDFLQLYNRIPITTLKLTGLESENPAFSLSSTKGDQTIEGSGSANPIVMDHRNGAKLAKKGLLQAEFRINRKNKSIGKASITVDLGSLQNISSTNFIVDANMDQLQDLSPWLLSVRLPYISGLRVHMNADIKNKIPITRMIDLQADEIYALGEGKNAILYDAHLYQPNQDTPLQVTFKGKLGNVLFVGQGQSTTTVPLQLLVLGKPTSVPFCIQLLAGKEFQNTQFNSCADNKNYKYDANIVRNIQTFDRNIKTTLNVPYIIRTQGTIILASHKINSINDLVISLNRSLFKGNIEFPSLMTPTRQTKIQLESDFLDMDDLLKIKGTTAPLTPLIREQKDLRSVQKGESTLSDFITYLLEHELFFSVKAKILKYEDVKYKDWVLSSSSTSNLMQIERFVLTDPSHGRMSLQARLTASGPSYRVVDLWLNPIWLSAGWVMEELGLPRVIEGKLQLVGHTQWSGLDYQKLQNTQTSQLGISLTNGLLNPIGLGNKKRLFQVGTIPIDCLVFKVDVNKTTSKISELMASGPHYTATGYGVVDHSKNILNFRLNSNNHSGQEKIMVVRGRLNIPTISFKMNSKMKRNTNASRDPLINVFKQYQNSCPSAENIVGLPQNRMILTP